MRKSVVIIFAVVFLCTIIAGCAASKEPEPAESTPAKAASAETKPAETKKFFKCGESTITLNGNYFTTQANTLAQKCYELGLIESPDDFVVLNADGNPEREVANMDSFIAQGYDLIFVDSTNPDQVVPMIDRAVEAGITVVCVGSYISGENQVTVVYHDGLGNGRLVGLEVAKKVDEDIYSILLSGVKGNVASEERRVGLMCGILEYRLGIPEEEAWDLAYKMNEELINNGFVENKDARFTIAGQGWGGWTATDVMKDANDLIVKAGDKLNAVFAENDQMLYGAMQAAADAGKTEGIYFACMSDGEVLSADYIKQGKMLASGLASPYQAAELAAQVAKEVLIDGKDPKSYPKTMKVPPGVITVENVDEMYKYCY